MILDLPYLIYFEKVVSVGQLLWEKMSFYNLKCYLEWQLAPVTFFHRKASCDHFTWLAAVLLSLKCLIINYIWNGLVYTEIYFFFFTSIFMKYSSTAFLTKLSFQLLCIVYVSSSHWWWKNSIKDRDRNLMERVWRMIVSL